MLFVDIADPDNWDLIVNKQNGEWGLAYDAAQDLGKVKMHMAKPAATIEELKYSIESTGEKSGKITLEWENHVASVPVYAEHPPAGGELSVPPAQVSR